MDTNPDPQRLIAERVRRDGAAHVARTLDVSRNTLLSFVAGTAREAQRLLIESRVDRLHVPAELQRPKP